MGISRHRADCADAQRLLVGNTVWQDGTLTGVVDWSGAALGPRAFDLGWRRLDLYLLFDQYIADRFLESYYPPPGS